MNKLVNNFEHEELAKCLCEPSALYALYWGRNDADDYDYIIHPLVNKVVPSLEEVSCIFPSGNKWSTSRGWRSIFGMPFQLHKQQFLAVGVESVYPHPRGAFPALDAYVYPMDQPPINGITNAIATIGAPTISNPLNATHGVISTSSQAPEEHKQIEVTILRHALASYKKQERLLFATLLLAEDILKMPGSPSYLPKSSCKNFMLDYERYLFATVAPVEKTFSFPARVWLKSSKHLW